MFRKALSFIAALVLSATAFAGRQVIVTTPGPGVTNGPQGGAIINANFAELYNSSIVPAPALAVGYTKRTFGPDVTLGLNWNLFNLLAVTPVAGQAVQNSDGSVSMGA